MYFLASVYLLDNLIEKRKKEKKEKKKGVKDIKICPYASNFSSFPGRHCYKYSQIHPKHDVGILEQR